MSPFVENQAIQLDPTPIDFAEVDRLIRDGAPLARIYPHFSNRPEAMTYYANAKCVQHGLAEAAGPCCICQAAERVAPVEFRWALSSVAFSTYHPVCDTCGANIRRRHSIGGMLYAPGILAVAAGPMLLAYALLFSPRIGWVIPIIAVALPCFGELLLWVRRRLRVPSALRHAIPKPLDCLTVSPATKP